MQAFYTLCELSRDGLGSLPAPAKLAVIGHPVAHSRSPYMQQAALDAGGETATYIRVQADLQEGDFAACVNRMAELGFIGTNVTVPFKKLAFGMSATADALSRICGASNTLCFTPNGISAHNTDGPGFAQAIACLCQRPLGTMNVLLLGACGGAGAALAAQCALSGCPQLALANRPRPQLAELAESLQPHVQPGNTMSTVSMADAAALATAVAAADLIVNATSLGLKEGDPLPLDPAWLRPEQTVYDIVPHDTPLRRAAAERGCLAADGSEMLLWQGACAYKLWYGYEPDVAAMRAALLATATA